MWHDYVVSWAFKPLLRLPLCSTLPLHECWSDVELWFAERCKRIPCREATAAELATCHTAAHIESVVAKAAEAALQGRRLVYLGCIMAWTPMFAPARSDVRPCQLVGPWKLLVPSPGQSSTSPLQHWFSTWMTLFLAGVSFQSLLS